MNKRFLKFSSILVILALGWVPVVVIYLSAGVTLQEDPREEHLPKGLSRIVHTYFTPAMAAEVSKISYHQSEHKMINVLGFSALGVYDPIMERIALSAQYGGDTMIVHEILHHVWFQNLVPEQESFADSYARFQTDGRYWALSAKVEQRWQNAHRNGEVAVLRLTELYCYIGEALAEREESTMDPGRGLPAYLARHYRGVLADGLLFDRSVYGLHGPSRRLYWDQIDARFQECGQTMRIIDDIEALSALYRLGGVIGWNISRHHWVVKRVGTSFAVGDHELMIVPRQKPGEVRLKIDSPLLGNIEFHRQSTRGDVLIGTGQFQELDEQQHSWYLLDWDLLNKVRLAYLDGELSTTKIPPLLLETIGERGW